MRFAPGGDAEQVPERVGHAFIMQNFPGGVNSGDWGPFEAQTVTATGRSGGGTNLPAGCHHLVQPKQVPLRSPLGFVEIICAAFFSR
jgi:hypothetical protein